MSQSLLTDQGSSDKFKASFTTQDGQRRRNPSILIRAVRTPETMRRPEMYWRGRNPSLLIRAVRTGYFFTHVKEGTAKVAIPPY